MVKRRMMVQSGTVVAISISRLKGIPKENVPSALLMSDWGIAGDAHAGTGHRQISLLAIESIERMRVLGARVSPGAFAENITTAGIDLLGATVGDRIRLGEAELVVTQLGKDCHNRCAIFEAVGDCVMPREGVFARVVAGGTVRPNDTIIAHLGTDSPQSFANEEEGRGSWGDGRC